MDPITAAGTALIQALPVQAPRMQLLSRLAHLQPLASKESFALSANEVVLFTLGSLPDPRSEPRAADASPIVEKALSFLYLVLTDERAVPVWVEQIVQSLYARLWRTVGDGIGEISRLPAELRSKGLELLLNCLTSTHVAYVSKSLKSVPFMGYCFSVLVNSLNMDQEVATLLKTLALLQRLLALTSPDIVAKYFPGVLVALHKACCGQGKRKGAVSGMAVLAATTAVLSVELDPKDKEQTFDRMSLRDFFRGLAAHTAKQGGARQDANDETKEAELSLPESRDGAELVDAPFDPVQRSESWKRSTSERVEPVMIEQFKFCARHRSWRARKSVAEACAQVLNGVKRAMKEWRFACIECLAILSEDPVAAVTETALKALETPATAMAIRSSLKDETLFLELKSRLRCIPRLAVTATYEELKQHLQGLAGILKLAPLNAWKLLNEGHDRGHSVPMETATEWLWTKLSPLFALDRQASRAPLLPYQQMQLLASSTGTGTNATATSAPYTISASLSVLASPYSILRDPEAVGFARRVLSMVARGCSSVAGSQQEDFPLQECVSQLCAAARNALAFTGVSDDQSSAPSRPGKAASPFQHIVGSHLIPAAKSATEYDRALSVLNEAHPKWVMALTFVHIVAEEYGSDFSSQDKERAGLVIMTEVYTATNKDGGIQPDGVLCVAAGVECLMEAAKLLGSKVKGYIPMFNFILLQALALRISPIQESCLRSLDGLYRLVHQEDERQCPPGTLGVHLLSECQAPLINTAREQLPLVATQPLTPLALGLLVHILGPGLDFLVAKDLCRSVLSELKRHMHSDAVSTSLLSVLHELSESITKQEVLRTAELSNELKAIAGDSKDHRGPAVGKQHQKLLFSPSWLGSLLQKTKDDIVDLQKHSAVWQTAPEEETKEEATAIAYSQQVRGALERWLKKHSMEASSSNTAQEGTPTVVRVDGSEDDEVGLNEDLLEQEHADADSAYITDEWGGDKGTFMAQLATMVAEFIPAPETWVSVAAVNTVSRCLQFFIAHSCHGLLEAIEALRTPFPPVSAPSETAPWLRRGMAYAQWKQLRLQHAKAKVLLRRGGQHYAQRVLHDSWEPLASALLNVISSLPLDLTKDLALSTASASPRSIALNPNSSVIPTPMPTATAVASLLAATLRASQGLATSVVSEALAHSDAQALPITPANQELQPFLMMKYTDSIATGVASALRRLLHSFSHYVYGPRGRQQKLRECGIPVAPLTIATQLMREGTRQPDCVATDPFVLPAEEDSGKEEEAGEASGAPILPAAARLDLEHKQRVRLCISLLDLVLSTCPLPSATPVAMSSWREWATGTNAPLPSAADSVSPPLEYFPHWAVPGGHSVDLLFDAVSLAREPPKPSSSGAVDRMRRYLSQLRCWISLHLTSVSGLFEGPAAHHPSSNPKLRTHYLAIWETLWPFCPQQWHDAVSSRFGEGQRSSSQHDCLPPSVSIAVQVLALRLLALSCSC